MPTQLTLQQKLDILTKDFLERDGDTFVRVRRSGRLGWESTLPEGSAYSAFIDGEDAREDVIRRAHETASQMVTVMDHDRKVNMRIVPGGDSLTDGSTVLVSTKVFDDGGLSTGEQADVFIGLAVHEGCHLLYTDFPVIGQAGGQTVRNLLNVIEDERVERLCCESRPGLANFLGRTKQWAFDRCRPDALPEQTAVERFLNTVLAYVRFPKALRVPDLEEFADRMLRVRDILTPFPESTRDSLEAAKRIFDLLADLQREQPQRQQQPQQQQASGGSGNDPQQEETQESASGSGSPQQEQGGSAQAENTQEDAQAQTPSRREAREQAERQLSRLNGRLSDLGTAPKTELTEGDCSRTLSEDNGRMGAYCQGASEKGTLKGTYVLRGTDNETVYNESLDRVRSFVPAIARILRAASTEYAYSLRGCRSGLLDTGKLAEAVQGVQTVYTRRGEVKTDRTAVCILMDESGSMWGPGIKAARDTAVLLNEALGKIPGIDLYIYGHTASRKNVELRVYREKGSCPKHALGSAEARAGNRDSIAIREACARVRRHTREKCLFFMISDGAPNESTDLVKKAVQDVERDGFKVVAVSIDPYYDPKSMYERNVTLTDLQKLAPQLGRLVRDAVLSNTGRHAV